MNILHLQNNINLACGVTKTIYLIVKNIDKSYQHNIICLSGDGLSRFEGIGLLPIIIHYNRFSFWGTFKIFIYLQKFCKKNKIDIIHSHHRYFDFLSSIIGKYLKIKTVMSVQSKVYGLRFFSYKSNQLIACSETIKNHLIDYFKINPKKIKVIYNFVDPEEVRVSISNTNLREKLGIQKNSNTIGFFGRFNNKEKGIDLLLSAFNILKKDYANLYLILVGNGIDLNYVNSFINKNKLKAIIIPSTKSIYDYYNICDIVVLPSRVEPFGIVTIEAGLMKKAVLGSNIDGIAEIINNNINGLLFEKNNCNDLVEKLKILLGDEELRKKIGFNLYNDVIEKYTKKISIPFYENVYSNL